MTPDTLRPVASIPTATDCTIVAKRTAVWTTAELMPASRSVFSRASMQPPQPFAGKTACDHKLKLTLSTTGFATTFARNRTGIALYSGLDAR